MIRSLHVKPLDSRAVYPWLAVQVKPRCQRTVAAAIRRKGFEEFAPRYRCLRRWSDRVKSLELPLFPGYIFCRVDPGCRLSVLTIPGVVRFVSIGRIPVAVDEGEIAALQDAGRSGLATEP